MKVAINVCYGGFGLSNKGFEALLDKKGIEWVNDGGQGWLTHYYQKDHVGDDNFYLSPYQLCEDRSDKDLIAVIEELGEESWGGCAELCIVEIPDDVKYGIHEYDGNEWVAEQHRTWP